MKTKGQIIWLCVLLIIALGACQNKAKPLDFSVAGAKTVFEEKRREYLSYVDRINLVLQQNNYAELVYRSEQLDYTAVLLNGCEINFKVYGKTAIGEQPNGKLFWRFFGNDDFRDLSSLPQNIELDFLAEMINEVALEKTSGAELKAFFLVKNNKQTVSDIRFSGNNSKAKGYPGGPGINYSLFLKENSQGYLDFSGEVDSYDFNIEDTFVKLQYLSVKYGLEGGPRYILEAASSMYEPQNASLRLFYDPSGTEVPLICWDGAKNCSPENYVPIREYAGFDLSFNDEYLFSLPVITEQHLAL